MTIRHLPTKVPFWHQKTVSRWWGWTFTCLWIGDITEEHSPIVSGLASIVGLIVMSAALVQWFGNSERRWQERGW